MPGSSSRYAAGGRWRRVSRPAGAGSSATVPAAGRAGLVVLISAGSSRRRHRGVTGQGGVRLVAGVRVLVSVEEERVCGRPVQVDPVADPEAVPRPAVLLEDGQLLPPGHPDEELGADPDEADVPDRAAAELVAGARGSAAPGQQHLLRPDPDPHRSVGTTGARGRPCQLAAVRVDQDVVAVTPD